MMTRKHFKAIAQVLLSLKPADTVCSDVGLARYDAWQQCVIQMANLCGNDNPRFDAVKFKRACNHGE